MRPEHVCYVQFLLPKPVLWTELIFSSTRWNDSLEKRLHCKFHKSKCSVTIAQARYCLHSKYFEYALLFIHEVIDTKGTLASPSTPCTIPRICHKLTTNIHHCTVSFIQNFLDTTMAPQWLGFVPEQTVEERKLSSTSWMGANASPAKVHQWHKQSIARTSLQATCPSLHLWHDAEQVCSTCVSFGFFAEQ